MDRLVLGSKLMITEENQDSTLTFSWTSAVYNLTELETTKYLLQMAKSGTNFESPTELTSTRAKMLIFFNTFMVSSLHILASRSLRLF